MVKFHLRKSKCDQFSTGADVLVGHSGCQHCPVAAILAYIKARSDHPGAFYVDNSRAPITKSKFIAKVRDVLRSAGFPEEQFRWAQLLYRHSDYRDNGGDRGFDDPNPRQLAQCHVSIIHSDPARLSSCPRHPARLREHISLRSEPCHGACSYTIIIYIYTCISSCLTHAVHLECLGGSRPPGLTLGQVYPAPYNRGVPSHHTPKHGATMLTTKPGAWPMLEPSYEHHASTNSSV